MLTELAPLAARRRPVGPDAQAWVLAELVSAAARAGDPDCAYRLATVLAGRAQPWRRQASLRESKETGAKAQPGRREPLSAITAGCVSLVAMLISGPVITSG